MTVAWALIAGSATVLQFPIGIYNVTAVDQLEELSSSGVTHVFPAGDSRELVSQAARRMRLNLVDIPPAAGSGLRRPDRDVAVWYIADEPEINSQSPEDISAIAARLRREAPGTPLTLVVGDGRFAGAYAASVDVVMVDWYPVPHLPLTSLGDQIGLAKAASGGKPIWAVVQAMDWRDYPQRNPRLPRVGRFPTRLELRFMAFHALVRGASGIWFFEFQRRPWPGKSLLDAPEHWVALKAVLEELALLRGFFLSGESQPNSLPPQLEGRTWIRGRERLTVLLNTGPDKMAVPPEFLGDAWHQILDDSPGSRRPKTSPTWLLPHHVQVLVSR